MLVFLTYLSAIYFNEALRPQIGEMFFGKEVDHSEDPVWQEDELTELQKDVKKRSDLKKQSDLEVDRAQASKTDL